MSPSTRLIVGEALAARQLGRLAVRSPELWRAPRGYGQPVVLVPGYGASEISMAPLQGYLTRLGYDAHGWGLGRNRGDFGSMVPGVIKLVDSLFFKSNSKVHLVGWSLGGVVSRAVARARPNKVAQVITYGSPLMDQGTYPASVPLTVLYSRNDAVVNWQQCIDQRTAHAENIEIHSSHLGMGIDPDVWRVTAERLARLT